jgi:hypothetical protein
MLCEIEAFPPITYTFFGFNVFNALCASELSVFPVVKSIGAFNFLANAEALTASAYPTPETNTTSAEVGQYVLAT